MAKSNRHILVAVLVCFGLYLGGCKPDEDVPVEKPQLGANRVMVINEGNFQWGNASLGAFLPDSNTYDGELFKRANGYPLGDVFQSLTLYDDSYLLVLNNSGKVLRIDTADLTVKKEYSGFQSPRYILPISDQKALVSDLYANKMSVLDLQTGVITQSIPLNGWSEQMMQIKDEIWIGNRANNKIYVLDGTDLTLTDSMELMHQVHSFDVDKTGMLWVICQGDELKKEKGGLFKIDPDRKMIVDSFEFEAKNNPFNLRMNQTRDTLYYLNQHIYRMGVDDADLPTTPFVDLSGKTPYALDIDPKDSRIYFADALDYVQSSQVTVYSSVNAGVLAQFKAGVLCSRFVFSQKK